MAKGQHTDGRKRKRDDDVEIDPSRDDAIAEEVYMVPKRCEPCSASHEKDAPVIFFGEPKAEMSRIKPSQKPHVLEQLGVYGCPYQTSASKTLQWRFQEMWLDRDGYLHSAPIPLEDVEYWHELLEPDLFRTPYAISKWPDAKDRKAAMLAWWFLIWQDRTGESAMPKAGLSTYKEQNAARHAEIEAAKAEDIVAGGRNDAGQLKDTEHKLTFCQTPLGTEQSTNTQLSSDEDEFDDPEYWRRRMRDPLEPIPSYEEACAFIYECERRGEDYSKTNRTKVLAAFDVICWDRFGWLE